MALVLANRVQESATANTTVSFTLSGAVAGFQTFAVVGDTNTTYYSATDSSGNWEVGLGTYATSGPTLTRTTIYASSNSNNAVTFSGAVTVFVTYPSGKSVNLDGSNNVSALGTVASGTWQGSTIGVAYGGTGVTASSGANSVVLRDSNENITANRVNQASATTTAAAGTTALTAASSYIQTLVGTGGQTYTLPDATTLTTGVAFVFNNLATGTLTIQDYATGPIGTIPSGGAGAVFLTNNGTVGGTWDLHAYLPEGVTFGTNAFSLGSSVISGGTWQGGTIQPAYGGTGLTTFVGANNALYSTGATTLTAGTLPVAAGGTGLTSGTSGGIPYYSASSTLASSAALASNALVIGGGAGVAPSTVTTGTDVITALGVNVGTAGAFVVNGGALGTPLSGTVTNLTGTASININGTVGATTPNTGAFTSVTSTSASGILTRAAATQDGMEIIGRAGGSASYKVTQTPTTLTASRTVTWPDANVDFTTGVAVANGGTGRATATAYAVLCGGTTSTGAHQSIAGVGTSGQVLTSNGAGALPTFQAAPAAASTISDDTSTNSTRYITFTSATSGTISTFNVSSTKLTYNPSTGALSSTTVAGSSDERLKTNWRDLQQDFIAQLAQVKAGVYDRTDHDVPLTQVGVTAQSLRPVLPHAVLEDADGMLSVAYGNAALVSAIKLAQCVVDQEARIKQLEATVAKLMGE